MLLTSFMVMLCTAGTAFYVRFLLALWKEWRLRSIRHLRLLSLSKRPLWAGRHALTTASGLGQVDLNTICQESMEDSY
jgi:hypothetical protein